MTKRARIELRSLTIAIAPAVALSLVGCNESWERQAPAVPGSMVVVGAATGEQAQEAAYPLPPASVIYASPEEQPPTF
jgi:hypothetical protein